MKLQRKGERYSIRSLGNQGQQPRYLADLQAAEQRYYRALQAPASYIEYRGY